MNERCDLPARPEVARCGHLNAATQPDDPTYHVSPTLSFV